LISPGAVCGRRYHYPINVGRGDDGTLAPVAVALAQALGRAPEPFVVTVAMASVVAFLTPIGHHRNLLVYGPGRYKFSDFVRVGTPLTAICALIVALLAPLVWRG
jgi:di/tricarboxylate transporter